MSGNAAVKRTGRRPSAGTLAIRAGIADVVAAYESGETAAAIAIRYRADREMVRRELVKAGAKSPTQRARADAEGVCRLRAQGLTMQAIADRYGVGEDTIRRIVLSADGGDPMPLTPRQIRQRAGSIRNISTETFREAFDRLGDAHAVAEEFGCHASTVRKRLGMVQPLRRPAMSLAAMKRAYEVEGQSIRGIAAAAGMYPSSVRNRLLGAGVELRSRGGSNYRAAPVALHRHRHAVALLFQAGLHANVIAEEFGCCRNTVRRLIVEKHGARRVVSPRTLSAERRDELRRLARAVRREELVVESGRLVPRLVARNQGRSSAPTPSNKTGG